MSARTLLLAIALAGIVVAVAGLVVHLAGRDAGDPNIAGYGTAIAAVGAGISLVANLARRNR